MERFRQNLAYDFGSEESKRKRMSAPKLSVIVANYNHARYLPRSLGAMLRQEQLPFEIIVIDDASRDESRQVMAELGAQNPLLRIVHNERNRGVAFTMNRGMELARGDYVYLAGADDKVLPGFFKKAMEKVARYPQAGMIFGQVGIMDERERELGFYGSSRWKKDCFAPPETFLREFLDAELATHSLGGSTIYKRSAILEMGGYRENLAPLMDTFCIRVVGMRYGGVYIHAPVMMWLVTPAGLAKSTPLEKILTIHHRTLELMRGEFRAVFPPEHVDRFEVDYRREVFREAIRTDHDRWLRLFNPFGVPGWHLKEFLVRQMGRLLARRWRDWKPADATVHQQQKAPAA